jgi:hypothetical protein
MAEIVTRRIFGPSGHPIGQKFLLAQIFAFFEHLVLGKKIRASFLWIVFFLE